MSISKMKHIKTWQKGMSISKKENIKLGKKPWFKYEKACNEPQRSCSQALKRERQENEASRGKAYPGGKGIKVSTASSLRLYLH